MMVHNIVMVASLLVNKKCHLLLVMVIFHFWQQKSWRIKPSLGMYTYGGFWKVSIYYTASWCNNHIEKWWSSSMGRMTSHILWLLWKIIQPCLKPPTRLIHFLYTTYLLIPRRCLCGIPSPAIAASTSWRYLEKGATVPRGSGRGETGRAVSVKKRWNFTRESTATLNICWYLIV